MESSMSERNEALKKALQELAQAEQTELASDLETVIAEGEDVIKSLTAVNDKLVDEFQTQNDSIAKGMIGIGHVVEQQAEDISALTDMVKGLTETVQKLIDGQDAIKKGFDTAPEGPRAVGGTTNPEPHPSETNGNGGDMPVDVNEAMNKAKAIMANPNTDDRTREKVVRLVTRMDSGAIVAKSFCGEIENLG
jgi:hypothetical protein